MRWVFSKSAIFYVKYLFSRSRYEIFKKSCLVSPVWCGGGWFPVKLAGNTLPTDSSEELLEVVSFFFFSFFESFFLVSLLDSDPPPTLADCAPLATAGDFSGLKFLKTNIFFFRGVPSSAVPTVVVALCNGDLNGGSIDFFSRFSPLADYGSL